MRHILAVLTMLGIVAVGTALLPQQPRHRCNGPVETLFLDCVK